MVAQLMSENEISDKLQPSYIYAENIGFHWLASAPRFIIYCPGNDGNSPSDRVAFRLSTRKDCSR